jgi:cytochrome c556
MIKPALATSALVFLAACDARSPVNNSVVTANSAEANVADTVAVDAGTARKVMHERETGMEAIGKATKAVATTLKSSSPDIAVVRSSAAKIADLAQKSANWFPAGTGPDVGKTRAKPEIWRKPQDFAARDRDFQQAARAFNAAATAGDLNAVKSSFDALGKTCKACHDSYRAEKPAE